jgi:hypothetical protein
MVHVRAVAAAVFTRPAVSVAIVATTTNHLRMGGS